MYHAVIAKINANVGRKVRIGSEKNQISLLKVTGRNFISDFKLFPCCSGKRDLQFTENLLYETGAIYAILAGTAEAIAGPEKTIRSSPEHFGIVGFQLQAIAQIYRLVWIGIS